MKPLVQVALYFITTLASLGSASASELVLIGTHGTGQRGAPDAPGTRHGIYAARLDVVSGKLTGLGLVSNIDHATWLVRHSRLPIIYSVGLAGANSAADASLFSLRVNSTNGELQQLSEVSAGGRDATHLHLDMRSSTLFAANYGSGSVTALPVNADGTLGQVASTLQHQGSGPTPRQTSAHAHGVALDPSGRYLLSTDLGADRLFVHRFDAAHRTLSEGSPAFEALPSGSGPRHLAFHPNGRFVFMNTELTAELRSFRWSARAGTLTPVQTLPALAADFKGVKSSGEVLLSRDGRHLYWSLRGDANSIVVYDVNSRSGTLSEIQRIDAQGKIPWSLVLDPSERWLLVTNEGSNTLDVLKRDRKTGKLSATGQSLAVPKPVTAVFPVS